MAQSKSSKPRSNPKTRTRKTSPEVVPAPSGITDEEIAVKAYELWESRGRPIGSPEEDWHNALEHLRTGA
jgi:hypothetical protein